MGVESYRVVVEAGLNPHVGCHGVDQERRNTECILIGIILRC